MELKKYLKSKAISVAQFAKVCGVDKSLVWKVCNGHRKNPSVRTAYRFILGSNGDLEITDFIPERDIQEIHDKIDV